jgi:hypothetical protein
MRAAAPFLLTEPLAATAAGGRREGFCKNLYDYDYDYEAGSRGYGLKLQASPPRGYAANDRGGNLKNAQEFATEGTEITEYDSCCKASSKALCELWCAKQTWQNEQTERSLPHELTVA